jgi:hypothetical protein
MEELLKYVKAMVALQLQQSAARDAEPGTVMKPELLLTRLGFTQKEVGDLLGKTTNAVKMAVRDAKKPRTVPK